MLRRTLLAAAALLVVAPASALAADPAPTVSATTFLVSGHGWGHGIGMSQYGAYGYAQHGWGYKQIVAHYYKGTALGTAPPTTLRVLLASNQKAVTVGSTQPFKVLDGAGVTHTIAAPATFGAGLAIQVDGHPFKTALPSPLTFLAGAAPLSLAARSYRGKLVVSSDGKRVTAINSLALESYVRGVVAMEMPHDWAPEALKAQAVVARSYALATKRVGGSFDVYGDTRSQVYGGLAGETPETDAAVKSTARQIATYKGKVATTFFYSTSGGRTASIQDVWNSPPIPYLVSVEDSYDSISPYHDWGPLVFQSAGVAKKLGVKGGVVDLEAIVNRSQRVGTVDVLKPDGTTATVSGTDVRGELGLRSTWFSIAALSLARPNEDMPFGGSVTLSGIARGVTGPVLESRVGNGLWKQVQAVAPSAEGTFSVTLAPQVISFYRLTTGKTTGAVLRVPVATVVNATLAGTAVTGSIQPALANGQVELQQLDVDGVTWTAVGTATTAADGTYTLPAPTIPGSYRVRVVTGRGYVPGISPTFTF